MPRAAEAEALHSKHVLDFRNAFGDGFHLFELLDGALGGGAGRQLQAGDDEALVFVREERSGQAQEEESGADANAQIDDKHQVADTDALGHGRFIGMGGSFDCAVEPAEETAFFVVIITHGFEHGGAEGRGEGQRQEA